MQDKDITESPLYKGTSPLLLRLQRRETHDPANLTPLQKTGFIREAAMFQYNSGLKLGEKKFIGEMSKTYAWTPGEAVHFLNHNLTSIFNAREFLEKWMQGR